MDILSNIDIQIIYDDADILVALKPAGIPVQPDLGGTPDMMSMLTQQYGTLWLVHRLDRVVGGLVVFARNKNAAAVLSRAVQADGNFGKSYYAIVPGDIKGAGTYTDLLFRDTRAHRAFVVDRMRHGVKEASLSWRALASQEVFGSRATMMEVSLHTGRFHQIRVQFASRGLPLLGDGKYGSRIKCPVALFAARLSFCHPVTRRRLEFKADPPQMPPWNAFDKHF